LRSAMYANSIAAAHFGLHVGEMTALDATSVATLLREFGQRSALRGENPFRAKAYARAADNLLALSLPLETIITQDRLREIPGVGDAIADIIKKLHATGTHPALEKMRKEIPSGVLDILTIPGLRADKVIKIYKELGITSLEGLEEATRKGQLQKVKGLGQALQTKIVNGLVMRREALGKRHVHRAAELLKSAEAHLKEVMPDIVRVTPTGDFRRGCELVGDLTLVAEVPNLSGGPKTIRAGGQLAAHLTNAAHYGISLLLATGSKAHLAGLREVAAKQHMTLEKRGLCRGNTIIAAATEEEIYKALGMQPVPPELREGQSEIARALTGELPELVADADIKGILHAHTDRSDGVDTLETMTEATLARGYQYFGVADHSQSAHYAGGLGADEIAEQQTEADRLNKKYGRSFRIFKGIESDILADGSLDYPDGVLDTFDFAVASVHGRFKLDRETQTDRIIRAVANPYTTILGHMTGRQLLRRPGYEIDVERVLAACAEHGVAVEINANPWRLDLDWRWHGTALRLGCMMSINPDAHSVREINLTHWGVEMARKGGVPKESVLNCLSQDEFAAYLEQRRAHRQGKVAPGRLPLRARATNAKSTSPHAVPRVR
jgi:DNA polymerase (family X)